MDLRSPLPPNDDTPITVASLLGSGHGHAVQFYERDDFLVASVADFLADGFAAGQPAIVIATPAHRDALEARLAQHGVDTAEACRAGRLTLLDARETLDAFMVGRAPDARRFHDVIGGVIERCVRGRASVGVRAFGEMVDLLWRDGNPEGAIQLESLWNELARTYDFSLLCGYAIENFADSAHADQFGEVCRQHRHVVPTESYTQVSDADRLVATSVLQQRAQALETEIARRVVLERRLRDALAERDRLLQEERAARSDADRARIAAQEASRAKSAFLAVMSHELRTPLNAIGGYVELLTMGVYGPLAEPQHEALERVRRSERHLLGLIDQVLSYAHVESGALRYQTTDVRMDDVLQSAGALTLPQLRAKELSYSCAPCDPSVAARADAEKVRQIVLNLLTNAIKFTPRGGRVHLECEAVGASVVVRVRDTGVGVPAGKLEWIFEPFVQADPELTRTHGGVGLGLAISRDLARGMGGDLRAESIEGVGSTFVLTIPRAQRADW